MKSFSKIEFPVRSTDLDVNAHVNNAKFLEYLEWGREDWFEQRGFKYDELKEQNLITVLARMEVDYRREARQNDTMTVYTWLSAVGRSSMQMEQKILNQYGEMITEAKATVVTVSAKERRPIAVPDEIRKHIALESPALVIN
ncbi:acyl-CoA thioesterase [Alicyclobacillus tolerans]|uniref:Acyl-CoA thioester hydrolase/thioesterase-3 n=1 Tax=Alicyclobacillus tolerans TaxID=90970 RepID=A0ABT9LZW7_9BACL|nr:thioesterase family protein [Alicyclobacillus tengchongensis]MDP9729800.1 acyl-CoA thioester hydrolase/thioesterase-3 [Alicyclobacillus tengchongensis]